MTTPLFKEALIESKKLRALATEEARNAVLESINPIIKEMLDRVVDGTSLLEDATEEPLPDPIAGALPTAEPTTAPPDATVAPMDASTPLPDTSGPTPDLSSAPISAGPPGMDIPMPGPDGKITVDIESLFQSTPEGQDPTLTTPGNDTTTLEPAPAENTVIGAAGPDVAIPTDLPPTPSPTMMEMLSSEIKKLESKISESRNADALKFAIVREMHENAVLELYARLQEAKEPNPTSALAALSESCLDLLYTQLQESAKEANSYKGQPQKEVNMNTENLKAFTAALFEEASAGFGDGGNAKQKVVNSNESDKASNAAKTNSDSTPVEDPGKKDALKIGGAEGFSESLEEEEMMKLENELKEMLGMEQEDDAPAMTETSTSDDEDEVKKESKKTALAEKLKSLQEETAKLQKELSECDMSGAGTPVNVNITIEPGAGAVAVHGADEPGAGDMGAGLSGDLGDTSGAPDMGGLGGDEGDLSDDDEIELVDDETPADDETEEPHSPHGLAESRKIVAENTALKKQLSETHLLTARSLYVNKLFVRENLSGDQKRKIVEYLDSARTLQEAKTIYGRIKKTLDERTAAAASKKSSKAGSNSAPSSSGGASGQTLNESWSFDTNRWAKLAGIVKKSS